jgi:Tol biopolymer transport system component
MQLLKLFALLLLLAVTSLSITAQASANQLVFVSGQETMTNLYLMNSDGSGLRQLTHDNRWNHDPVWSPDGTQIAFTSTEFDENDAPVASEIRIIFVDGSQQRNITQALQADGLATFTPAWSADGEWIAFSGADASRLGEASNTSQIYRIHTTTLEILPITDFSSSGAGCWAAQWLLPDSQCILMYCHDLMQGGIVIHDIATAQSKELVDWAWADTFVSNLDGQYFAYEESTLWYIKDIVNHKERRLNLDEREFIPVLSWAWSPLNASEFMVQTPVSFYHGRMGAEGLENIELEALPVDVAMASLLDELVGDLAWSSDGDSIVFTAQVDGNQELFVMQVDGTGLLRLTHNEVFDGQPRWQPRTMP